MRSIATKTDGIGDTLSAGPFNANFKNELEALCTNADFSLDPENGPDTNLNMIQQSVAAYANAGNVYQDSGTPNSYVLALTSNLKHVFKYYKNMLVTFKAGNSNTGASIVNINSIGTKSIKHIGGATLYAGEIVAGGFYSLIFNFSGDYFELVDLNNNEYSRPYNWILNGDHRINQLGFAGPSAGGNSTYQSTDQWETLLNGVTANIQLITASQPSSLSGSQSLKIIATSSASGKIGFEQQIENYSLFSSKICSLSSWVKSNSSDSRLVIDDGVNQTVSSAHTGGGNWELLTVLIAIDSSNTKLSVLPRIVDADGSSDVSITSGDYIEFTGVNLNFGLKLFNFEPRPYSEELRKCQRYFNRLIGSVVSGNPESYSSVGVALSTTVGYIVINSDVEMRIPPSISWSNLRVVEQFSLGFALTGLTSPTYSSKKCITCHFTVASGLTTGRFYYIESNNLSAKLDLIAQL